MTVLKIALMGALPAGVAQLADVLNDSSQRANWQTLVVGVIADTPALQAELASFDLVLLMGLEAIMVPSLMSYPPATTLDVASEAADQSIRAALTQAAVAYQVLYGSQEERRDHALHAIESLLLASAPRPRKSLPSGSGGARNKPWVWMCDKCGDPQCEHQLLTTLLAQRAGTGLTARWQPWR